MRLIQIALLAAVMLSSACATSGQGQNSPAYCDKAKPIYMDAEDRVTLDTMREILEHNDQGHVICGWPYAN